jgi:hypothetical protein
VTIGTEINTVHQYLEFVSSSAYLLDEFNKHTKRSAWVYRTYEEAVLKLGKPYTAARRPKGTRKQANRQCFRNTFHLVHWSEDLVYVEGYAVSEDGFPTMHAWAATRDGVVVDTTWKHPERASYYGIPFPSFLEVCKLAARHGVFGILGNDYQHGAPLLREGRFWPSEASGG